MKNSLKVYIVSLLLFVICFFYNNIQAKDIIIRATKDSDTKGINFFTEVVAYAPSVKNWLNLSQKERDKKSSCYNADHQEFPNGITQKDFEGNSWVPGTIRSYSYVIHNKQFTKYSARKFLWICNRIWKECN